MRERSDQVNRSRDGCDDKGATHQPQWNGVGKEQELEHEHDDDPNHDECGAQSDAKPTCGRGTYEPGVGRAPSVVAKNPGERPDPDCREQDPNRGNGNEEHGRGRGQGFRMVVRGDLTDRA